MKKSAFFDEQIAYALRQAVAGTLVGDMGRQLGCSEASFSAWRKRYGALGVTELHEREARVEVSDSRSTYSAVRASSTRVDLRLLFLLEGRKVATLICALPWIHKESVMRCVRWLEIVLLAVLSVVAAPAQSASFVPIPQGTPMDSSDRFRAYGDNYAAYQWVKNDNWANHWEGDLQGHFSLGYTFKRTQESEFLFTYTGEFDFYLFDRPSGPVVNRLNNPAFHFAFLPALIKHDSKWAAIFDAGLEHESDGQVTEVSTAEDALVAQENYAAGNKPFFDQISRGSDFLSMSARMPQHDKWDLPISIRLSARMYLDQDYKVAWGPLGANHKRLSDFNVLRTRIGHEGRWGSFELQWTVGTTFFKDQSFDLFWQAKTSNDPSKWGFPWFIKLHHGPLNILSNYTQKQDSIGFGWRFSSTPEQDRRLLRATNYQ